MSGGDRASKIVEIPGIVKVKAGVWYCVFPFLILAKLLNKPLKYCIQDRRLNST